MARIIDRIGIPGLTSVGADEATVGFVWSIPGRKGSMVQTERCNRVCCSKIGTRQSSGEAISASQPIPYNINNIPTYVMTLKDDGGLVKMFAMVAIEDYTIVGVGNTLTETLMAYKNAFNMAGNKINPKSITKKQVLIR